MAQEQKNEKVGAVVAPTTQEGSSEPTSQEESTTVYDSAMKAAEGAGYYARVGLVSLWGGLCATFNGLYEAGGKFAEGWNYQPEVTDDNQDDAQQG